MKKLDLGLLMTLFASFLLSMLGFTGGDMNAGFCGLSLTFLLGVMNVVNLLIDIRNELRRRHHDLGYG